ncbi:MAG: GNAT family N-acetyltransferase [Candidatus Thorarchaeota archaeon]
MPINLEHINLYLKWTNDANVRRYARVIYPMTAEELKKFLEGQQQNSQVKKFIDFIIFHKESKKLIGDCGIFNIDWVDRKGIVAYTIGEPEYWGKGICTEAVKLITRYGFEELNLIKLLAHIYAPNTGSYRCVEKNGYTLEATLKKDTYVDGKYLDTCIYSLFKEDWIQQEEDKTDTKSNKRFY